MAKRLLVFMLLLALFASDVSLVNVTGAKFPIGLPFHPPKSGSFRPPKGGFRPPKNRCVSDICNSYCKMKGHASGKCNGFPSSCTCSKPRA